jgi:hypothetical protein
MNPDSREVFGCARASSASCALPRRARLPRGRDADDAADPRRRGGAPVRHPPQRARHGPVPAHRARAVPQAPGGRRLRARLRDQPQLPQRGAVHAAQPRVHHARALPGLCGLPRPDGPHRGAAARLAGRCSAPPRPTRGTPSISAGRFRADARPCVELQPGSPPSGCRDRERCARPWRAMGEASAVADGLRGPGKLLDRDLREDRRGEAGAADLHHRLSGRGLAAGARNDSDPDPGHRPLRAVRRRARDRQRLLRAERSRGPGGALPEQVEQKEAATRRPCTTTPTTCARWSTACRPPAGSASASTAW